MENEKIETNAENNINQQNSNSEVKSRNKNLTIVLVSVIIVLLISIGVCAGLWFAGDTTKIINNKEEVVKEENTSKKIDETKPWVYDADYSKDKENKIVEDYDFNKDVKVPYININSKDAEKVNNEIKNIYEEVYSKYGSKESNTYNGISWEVQMIYYVEYEYYENDNILSVVLRVADVAVNGGTGLSKLYVYNFDLNTLNVATFEEMAKLCGFTSTSEVIELINKWETKQNNFANSNEDGVAGTMMGVVDGQYFIDASKKLNFVYLLGAAGTYYTPSVIEPNMEIEDFYDMSNTDEPQVQKSIFDEANSLKFTSNLTDDINGKIALLKLGENEFKTEICDGYYKYNAWNEVAPDWHYIKEIKSITSEFCDLNNYKTSALFKCTMKYIDNNNQEKSVQVAVIVGKDFSGSLWGNFENYTGSSMCSRQFGDVYQDSATEQEIAEIQEFLNKGENNGFVQINFEEDTANGLKLRKILNAMPDGGESLMNTYWTDEELKEVGVSNEQLHKYDVSKLNEFFYKKLGLTLDRIKNLNTDGMTYSAKYNAYYTSFGDTDYCQVEITQCTKDYGGGIFYVKGKCAEKEFETELLKTDDGYQFRYNVVK